MPTSKAMRKHPNTFHYIWEGSNIPEKFIPTIMGTAAKAQAGGYQLKLWLDNHENYYKTLRKFTDIEEIPGLELCDLNSLDSVINKSFTSNEGKAIRQILAEEAVGGKNMASLSDIQRLLILLSEGGTYCDLDNTFSNIEHHFGSAQLSFASISGAIEEHLARLKFQELYQPINLMAGKSKASEVTGFKPIYSKHGFLLASVGESSNLDVIQNSLLSAVPKNPIIKQLLLDIIAAYQRLSNEPGDPVIDYKAKFVPSIIDRKRNPVKGPLGRMEKLHYTREATGPSLYYKTLTSYFKKHKIKIAELIRPLRELGDYQINSEVSWLREENDPIHLTMHQFSKPEMDERVNAVKKRGKRPYDTNTMTDPNQPNPYKPILSRAEQRDILSMHIPKSEKKPVNNSSNTAGKEEAATLSLESRQGLNQLLLHYEPGQKNAFDNALHLFSKKYDKKQSKLNQAAQALREGQLQEEHKEVIKDSPLSKLLEPFISEHGYDSLDDFLDQEIKLSKTQTTHKHS